MDKYIIKFDEINSNMIIISEGKRLITTIACPPIEKGCDLINFNGTVSKIYTFNFDGLILITTKEERKLWYKGGLIAETKR